MRYSYNNKPNHPRNISDQREVGRYDASSDSYDRRSDRSSWRRDGADSRLQSGWGRMSLRRNAFGKEHFYDDEFIDDDEQFRRSSKSEAVVPRRDNQPFVYDNYWTSGEGYYNVHDKSLARELVGYVGRMALRGLGRARDLAAREFYNTRQSRKKIMSLGAAGIAIVSFGGGAYFVDSAPKAGASTRGIGLGPNQVISSAFTSQANEGKISYELKGDNSSMIEKKGVITAKVSVWIAKDTTNWYYSLDSEESLSACRSDYHKDEEAIKRQIKENPDLYATRSVPSRAIQNAKEIRIMQKASSQSKEGSEIAENMCKKK